MTKNSNCRDITGLAYASPVAFIIKIFFFLFFISISLPALAKKDAAQRFSQGLQAAKSGDYENAITHFRHARRLGKRSDALLYNLGVCFFKLEDYESSITWFELLLRSEKNRGLALYNLGLAHSHLGQDVRAVRWFKRVLSSDANKKVKALAARQIKTIYKEKRSQIKQVRKKKQAALNDRWQAGVNFNLGWDDNIQFPESDSSSEEGDSFVDYYTWARARVLGDSKKGIRTRVTAYGTQYDKAGTYDRQTLQVDVSSYVRLNTWTYELLAGLDKIDLGGEDYLSVEKYSASARKYIKPGSTALIKYGYEHIEDASSLGLYSHLAGNRQQLAFHYYSGNGPFRYKLHYNVEKNSRGDRDLNPWYFSYSPFRQTLGLRWEQTWLGHLRTWQGVSYRYSQFRDENVFQENGTEEIRQREDEKTSLQLGVGYRFNSKIALNLEYTSNKSDSNISYYEYQQDVISLGLRFSL